MQNKLELSEQKTEVLGCVPLCRREGVPVDTLEVWNAHSVFKFSEVVWGTS